MTASQHFCLSVCVPCFAWSSPLSPPLWIPGQSLPGDVTGRLPEGVAKPTPLFSADLCSHWFLFAVFHRSSFLIFSGHRIQRILHRQLLMTVWSLWSGNFKLQTCMGSAVSVLNGRTEVLTSLRNFLNMEKPEHHSFNSVLAVSSKFSVTTGNLFYISGSCECRSKLTNET